jgi:hypothetical protein
VAHDLALVLDEDRGAHAARGVVDVSREGV